MIFRAVVRVIDHHGVAINLDASAIVRAQTKDVTAGCRDRDKARGHQGIRFSRSVWQWQIALVVPIAAVAQKIELRNDSGGFAGNVGVPFGQGH